MRGFYLTQTDEAIYWQKTGVDDAAQETFAAPVIIKCRWDIVQTNTEAVDAVTVEAPSNTVFPDRVLVIGSYLLLGGQERLGGLTEQEKSNPKRIREARSIKNQSTVAELRWRQKEWLPNTMAQPNHLVVECSI